MIGVEVIPNGVTSLRPPLPPCASPAGYRDEAVHDMVQSVHEVAEVVEEARRTNDLLREVKDLLGDNVRETQHARQTLELIRNENRMRSDGGSLGF